MCYQDMSIFIDFVWSSGYAFEFAQYAQTAMAKGKTPTDGGFAVLIQEFGLDMGLLFFNVFTACYLENLLMLIGTFTQNLARRAMGGVDKSCGLAHDGRERDEGEPRARCVRRAR